MGQGPPRFVAQDIRKLLEADLDVLGGFVIVGEVGRVPPSLLLSGGSGQNHHQHRDANWQAAWEILTRSWLYSFSKR